MSNGPQHDWLGWLLVASLVGVIAVPVAIIIGAAIFCSS
jgi:hypothetical protein